MSFWVEIIQPSYTDLTVYEYDYCFKDPYLFWGKAAEGGGGFKFWSHPQKQAQGAKYMPYFWLGLRTRLNIQ